MDEMENRQKFKEWCQQIKARRKANNSPAGHVHLAALIERARSVLDELHDIAYMIEQAADGIGRGLHYARQAGGAIEGVGEMLDCVEEQLDRAREAEDGRAGENDRASQD
jgi:hypothetical protein